MNQLKEIDRECKTKALPSRSEGNGASHERIEERYWYLASEEPGPLPWALAMVRLQKEQGMTLEEAAEYLKNVKLRPHRQDGTPIYPKSYVKDENEKAS